MKKQLAALFLGASLLAAPAKAVNVTLSGAPLDLGSAPIYEDTAYVPLTRFIQLLCPDAAVSWENRQAVVRREGFTLTAAPYSRTLTCNGASTPLTVPIRLESDRTMVPIRPLAALLGYDVAWNDRERTVELTPAKPAPSYTEDQVYWLSRIISAESRGEPWEGKIAVGNVVLNRVASPLFPDTIYGVIFDSRWGGQFEPVRNGTIYQTPTDESVKAAIACLEGANTVGDSLYFLAPHLTSNHWTMENREYVTTIGAHWFYR